MSFACYESSRFLSISCSVAKKYERLGCEVNGYQERIVRMTTSESVAETLLGVDPAIVTVFTRTTFKSACADNKQSECQATVSGGEEKTQAAESREHTSCSCRGCSHLVALLGTLLFPLISFFHFSLDTQPVMTFRVVNPKFHLTHSTYQA